MADSEVSFLKAIEQLEAEKGIAHEVTIQALKEAFDAIFKKKNYEDTRVEVDIDTQQEKINIYIIKNVVDDVLDDALEISLEDAQEIDPNIKVGDDCKIKTAIEDLTKADVIKFTSIFKQKIKEAEKAAIYAAFSDKAGELITGTVEKIEPKYTIISIGNGKTTVTLSNQHKIGDEQFRMGQTIKVYLSQVNSSTGGPLIQVSRADAGFLRRLFEEEIPEIYDGTVVIKGVARRAGERSKVSVYSNDLNVDPIGACIGQGGSKIQKICAQLGKEKIDIVQYHEYPGAFIAEALKPAQVLGVNLNEENKTAIAVVRNDDLRVAIGKRGINAFLAVELTKYKIDIKEEDDAIASGIEYESLEKMMAKDQALILARKRDELLKARAAQEELKAKAKPVEEEVYDQFDDEYEEEVVSEAVEEETPVEVPSNEVVEEVKEEVKPVEEEKVEYNPIRMQPKFSLSDLEKQIEEEKKKKTQQPVKKKVNKVEEEKEEVEEEKVVVKAEPKKYMSIYTPEEEEEFEEEEDDLSKYDDDRFDEYDDDSYYEED